MKQYQKKWKEKNNLSSADLIRKFRQDNPEYQSEWRKKNPDKQKRYERACVKSGYNRYKQSQKRVRKIQRTPSWSEKEQIKEFYMNCPPGYHVDHVIPLKGEYVSGLHVLGNLQYLPKKENIKKSNKFNPG